MKMVIILAYKIKKSVLQISNPRKKRPKRQVSPTLCRYFDSSCESHSGIKWPCREYM